MPAVNGPFGGDNEFALPVGPPVRQVRPCARVVRPPTAAGVGRTRPKCRGLVMRMWSRRSRRRVPIQRSAIAFARGARTGVQMMRMSALANTALLPNVLLSDSCCPGNNTAE
jgi:hypothetical protein